MKHHRGKSFLAPNQLLRADVAKYIPNMQGYTLAKSWSYHDTTPALKGKVSIISISSGNWALEQVSTFLGDKENPEFAPLMKEFEPHGLQRLWINYERDLFKAILIRLCLPYARRFFQKEEWPRSFVMRKGVDRELLESFGVTNTKVGYVFLVDQNCKIRWAGNGDATDEERKNMLKVIRRLMEQTLEAAKAKRKVLAAKRPSLMNFRR